MVCVLLQSDVFLGTGAKVWLLQLAWHLSYQYCVHVYIILHSVVTIFHIFLALIFFYLL